MRAVAAANAADLSPSPPVLLPASGAPLPLEDVSEAAPASSREVRRLMTSVLRVHEPPLELAAAGQELPSPPHTPQLPVTTAVHNQKERFEGGHGTHASKFAEASGHVPPEPPQTPHLQAKDNQGCESGSPNVRMAEIDSTHAS